jgi:preprotein translocase subunit SecD
LRRLREVAAAVAVLAFVHGAFAAETLVLAVKTALVLRDQTTGEPVLSLTLMPDSAKAFGELTAANVGRVVELRLDGKVVMAPVVRDPILGGLVNVSGAFAPTELEDVADRIARGDVRVEVAVKPAE